VLKYGDQAIAQRRVVNCIINGFHSQIEKDVKRITFNTAKIKNRLTIDLAASSAIVYLQKHGNLEKLNNKTVE